MQQQQKKKKKKEEEEEESTRTHTRTQTRGHAQSPVSSTLIHPLYLLIAAKARRPTPMHTPRYLLSLRKFSGAHLNIHPQPA